MAQGIDSSSNSNSKGPGNTESSRDPGGLQDGVPGTTRGDTAAAWSTMFAEVDLSWIYFREHCGDSYQ